MTDVRPVVLRNRHDLRRLVDKGVPDIATAIDDVVEGFEDAERIHRREIRLAVREAPQDATQIVKDASVPIW
jgi:hypothetical protein